jgi:hypothetical protein
MKKQRNITRIFNWVILPGTLLMAAAMGAKAYDTSWIVTGQPVSSSKLKANFDELQSRLISLEAQHTETAIISGGCLVSSKSSAWLTPSSNGAGDCSILFTPGTFPVVPTCIATSYGTNGAWPRYAYVVKINNLNGLGNPSATGLRARHLSIDTTIGPTNSAPADEAFGIACTGSR